ncbi:MAG: insulinase family protein [Alphaproteobacteria bacterium]|nr:insulinase family protein [Alphaproteobacteria bacterium]MBV9371060.1 insulinase family protein [Alphaproteobacteria bacterium]MBV9901566.1 insulinase family protein [Alphaproteobacteria bacterium]
MKRILAAVFLAGLAPSAAAAPAAPPAASADLPADPAVRFGTLPNGLRFAVMRNATPKGEASLRLRIAAGSLAEEEDQRGLAHFIEHMVLNGTRHVPEGEFVRRLEREGLKFGPDTNASTTFEQTVYMLDVPQADAGKLDTALYLLREVAGEATLDPAAIDRERGVILSEERTRAGPAYRVLVDEIGYLFRGDLLAKRLPIGDTGVVRTAPRDRFADFYRRYYRPERAMLVAVGDFDPAAMEARIRLRFGDWKGRGAAGREPPPPVIPRRGAESRVLIEPGGQNRVSIAWLRPHDPRPDSRALRRERLVERLALIILNRRLERLATGDDPPFLAAGASIDEQAERARVVQLAALAEPGAWSRALAAVEQEARRAAEHGFGQAELDREVTEIRARLAAAVAGAATRSTPGLAQGLVAAANEAEVFTAPETNLALFDAAVKDLKAADVAAALPRLFGGEGPLLYLTSTVPLAQGEAALAAAYDKSRATPVAAAGSEQAKAWPYRGFGAPGAVTERREIAGLGTVAVRFANGVRLLVKRTDFKKNQILVAVRYGGGQLDLPRDRDNPLWAFGSAFAAGGLGRLTEDEMKQALAGTVYSIGAGVDSDAFTLAGGTRPADFERQMQLLAAFVADPGWRPTGWERLRRYAPTLHEQMEATPGGVFQRDVAALLRSGDRRWATPSREAMAASGIADARALVGPALARGPIEVVVVGDVTVEEAIRQTAATFGALPARAATPGDPAARQVRFPEPALVTRTHKGRADQGLAFIAWPTADFYADTRRARTLNLLGQVMQLRLTDEIREKQATTYSPSAGHAPSDTFPGYGYLSASIEAPPEKLGGFFADALKIAADLRNRAVGPDELERARRPLVDNLERQQAGNGWWLSQLPGAADRPERAESLRNALAQYRSITAAELREAARQYLLEARAWRFEALPERADAR